MISNQGFSINFTYGSMQQRQRNRFKTFADIVYADNQACRTLIEGFP